MKIALISCTKTKKSYKCKARELYSPSNLFSISYNYAKILDVDAIYILSAKYGLLNENDIVEPYEKKVDDLSHLEKIEWANLVKRQLEKEFDMFDVEFIILTGKSYLNPLLDVKAFSKFTFPLEGMALGERQSFMKKQIKHLEAMESTITPDSKCGILHKLFSEQRYYNYTEIDQIEFNNGIYIIFEKGEHYKEFHRVVRVGTHTSPNRLKGRLKNHYINKNKDGSIFRKNIGKAILNKRNDEYLDKWNINTSIPENKQYANWDTQAKIEEEVSAYLNDNTFFIVFQIEDRDTRLRIESGIIATLNACQDFMRSNQWLGSYSTEYEIRNSGLWLKKGLHDEILNSEEMILLNGILNKKTEWRTEFVQTTQVLEEEVQVLKQENLTALDEEPTAKSSTKVTTNDICEFINCLKEGALESSITLVANQIHKELNLKDRMPMVCNAMKRCMFPGDEILFATASGYSSRLEIKYYLEERDGREEIELLQ